MNKVNLTQLVMDNLEFLGLNVEFCYKNKEIIKYYLNTDITSIFGKTTFDVDSFNESNSEINIIKFTYDKQKIIRIICDGMFFDFIKHGEELVLLNRSTGFKLFKISLKNNVYQNILVNIDEPNIISEIQKYDMDLNECEYTKTLKCFGEETKYPVFKIKPLLSKNKDMELFELSYVVPESEEMSLIDKIKYKFNSRQTISMPTGYGVTKYSYYINEIFDILKKECDKLEAQKTRKK